MNNLILKNHILYLELHCQNGIFIKKYGNLLIPDPVVCTREKGELFVLTAEDTALHTGDFIVTDICRIQDKTEELCSISLENSANRLHLRVCLVNNLKDTISVIFQMADDSPDGYQKNWNLHSPFLANLCLPVSDGCRVYYPENPVSRKNGAPAMQMYAQAHLPLVLTDSDDRAGLAVSFPSLSDLEVAVQNRNAELWHLASDSDLKKHSLPLRPTHILADMAEFSICGLREGWREAFGRTRTAFRKSLDLRQYRRPEFEWFRDAFLHHFSFLYSKEAYDYENNRTDIEKLAKDGEDFGGYDTVTLWHQYPRLGVDMRTQWDFFRDYPGSLSGLADTIRTAHEKNIRVFLPYKPWDLPDSQSMNDITEHLAELIKITDADGFFLDTMDSAPHKFRESADRAKPGVLFCSEAHPATGDSLALLTASWDQFWSRRCMPEVDLLRFLLPEHLAPQISRWKFGREKDEFINRAIFSGAGLVIWQDVFGSWLPFTAEQKEKIRMYKKLWTAHKKIFQGSNPIPYYPVKNRSIYCNYFTDDEQTGVIYTLYNDSDSEIDGIVLRHNTPALSNLHCLWGGADFTLKNGEVSGILPPQEVTVLYFS